MGLGTFLSQLVSGSRGKNVKPSSSSRPDISRSKTAPAARQTQTYYADSDVLSSGRPSAPAVSVPDSKAKRHSQNPTLTKQKSERNLKRRLSWFGGKPDEERNIPAVPVLPRPHESNNRILENPFADEVAGPAKSQPLPRSKTVTSAAPEGKQHRKSLFGTTKEEQSSKLKSRKSWAGAPAPKGNAPPVPAMPQSSLKHSKSSTSQYDLKTRQSWAGGQVQKSDVLPVPALPRSNRNRSQSSTQPTLKTRQSWAGGLVQKVDIPPTPALPRTQEFRHGAESVEAIDGDQKESKRKSLSRVLSRSRTKSEARLKQNSVKRKSSWLPSSSNPADDNQDVKPSPPPLPALMRDDGETSLDDSLSRGDSVHRHRPVSGVSLKRHRSYVPKYAANGFIKSTEPRREQNAVSVLEDEEVDLVITRTMSGGNDIHQPRPVSGVSQNRRSYVPQYAANGFLKTTENKREGKPESMLNNGEGGIMCLSEEQQSEWDKLKNLLEVMERRQDNIAESVSSEDTDTGVMGMLRELEMEDNHQYDRRKYANDEALAALEFGEAR